VFLEDEKGRNGEGGGEFLDFGFLLNLEPGTQNKESGI
jgi:hypothetical protein